MTSAAITPASHGRRPLYLLLLTFIVPFAAAAIVLKTGLYSTIGTTNHGTLIEQSLTLDQILNTQPTSSESINPNTWKLMFIMPSQCDNTCENGLYLLKQIEIAMGPDKPRVDTLVIQPQRRNELDQVMQPVLSQPKFAQKEMSPSASPSERKYLYLVDPQGRVFMHYSVMADRHEAVLHGRDIVKDMKHALKLSKIG